MKRASIANAKFDAQVVWSVVTESDAIDYQINLLCISCSGGLGGSEGWFEQRAEYTEAHSQQGQIAQFGLKTSVLFDQYTGFFSTFDAVL